MLLRSAYVFAAHLSLNRLNFKINEYVFSWLNRIQFPLTDDATCLQWGCSSSKCVWRKHLPSDLSQRPGCSVASEGNSLIPRCVGSPCWSRSERGDSRLTQRTSPQSLPAAERGHTRGIQLLLRQISLRTELHLYEGEVSTYVRVKLTFLLIMLFSKYLCN